MEFIDTHCHLDMDAYREDLEEVIQSAAAAGVTHIITIGIDPESCEKAVGLARRFPGVFATVGIHPHHADQAGTRELRRLAELAADAENKVVGFGEIGLDYFKDYVARETQQVNFTQQVTLAKQLELPLIIHDRSAHEDTLRILRDSAPYPAGGVMHCFSGDSTLAHEVLDLGFHISIPGVITFKNSEILQRVAQEIPLERMVLETDGPFLAPVPHRAKRNVPRHLLHTAEKIAALRGIPLAELAAVTTQNARRLFRLPPVT